MTQQSISEFLLIVNLEIMSDCDVTPRNGGGFPTAKVRVLWDSISSRATGNKRKRATARAHRGCGPGNMLPLRPAEYRADEYHGSADFAGEISAHQASQRHAA